MDTSVSTSLPGARRPGFWQRRIVAPLIFLLTHGVTPERIALTLAVGVVCAMFPILGTTWLLTLAAGLWLRMNHPILQAINQLLTPVHIAMILVYVRIGEWIWGAQTDVFSVNELVRTFHDTTLGEFLQRFGWAGIHAVTAWAITAPLLFALIYLPLRPIMRRFARKRVPGEGV